MGKDSHNKLHDEDENKDPKKVLKDWVENVRHSAERGRSALKASESAVFNRTKKQYLDSALEDMYDILGQCKAMMTVLNNSD